MVIYKTTNLINGKIYIGQSSRDDNRYLGSGLLITRAIKKYSKFNFKKEILEYCSNQQELDKQEKYWIAYFKSADMLIGYNISPGGRCGYLCKNFPEKLRGKNHYLNKLPNFQKEKHLNTFRRGVNYWKSKGFTTNKEIKIWIKNNWCGNNHSHKKNKTEEEYQQWLDKNYRGNNFWLNKLSKLEREKYINEHYIGKNNPIFKNKTNDEIEDWLNEHRRNGNAPNAKYNYEIITNTGEIIITNCLKQTCKERKFNLHVLLKFIEVSEGKRIEFIPRKKEYLGWSAKKLKRNRRCKNG